MVATNFFSGLGALLLLCVALAVLPIDVLTTLSHASSSQWVLIGVVGAIATLGQMPFGAVADPHAVQLRSDRLRRADQLAAVSTRAGRVGRGRHGPHRVRRRGNGLAQCAGSLERPRLSGTMRTGCRPRPGSLYRQVTETGRSTALSTLTGSSRGEKRDVDLSSVRSHRRKRATV
jgi:hypothetical protein